MAWWRRALGAQTLGPTALSGAHCAGRVGGVAVPVEAILRDCCSFRSPAVVVPRSGTGICRGWFAGLTPSEVTLDLPSGARFSELQPPAACSVQFSQRGQAMVFVARVRRLDGGDSSDRPRQLALRIPEAVACADLRSAVRTRNPLGHELQARLRTRRGEMLFPLLLNLSHSGALLELPPDAPDLPVGAEIAFFLHLGKEVLALTGAVRRRDGPRIGIVFPEVLHGGEVEPPRALTAIVQSLGQLWVRRRSEVEDASITSNATP